MNIKSKLNDLENKIKNSFCNCRNKSQVEAGNIKELAFDGIKVTLPDIIDPNTDNLVIRDFCDECGKPVDKEQIKDAHRKLMRMIGEI